VSLQTEIVNRRITRLFDAVRISNIETVWKYPASLISSRPNDHGLDVLVPHPAAALPPIRTACRCCEKLCVQTDIDLSHVRSSMKNFLPTVFAHHTQTYSCMI
jgi:hypothetical protein